MLHIFNLYLHIFSILHIYAYFSIFQSAYFCIFCLIIFAYLMHIFSCILLHIFGLHKNPYECIFCTFTYVDLCRPKHYSSFVQRRLHRVHKGFSSWLTLPYSAGGPYTSSSFNRFSPFFDCFQFRIDIRQKITPFCIITMTYTRSLARLLVMLLIYVYKQ